MPRNVLTITMSSLQLKMKWKIVLPQLTEFKKSSEKHPKKNFNLIRYK